MNLELVIAVLSLCISFASICYTSKVKRRVDRQLIKINDYILKDYETKEREKKQAKFVVSYIGTFDGKQKIKIKNTGQADARNVYFKDISDDSKYVLSMPPNIFPIEIFSSESEVYFSIMLLSNGQGTCKFEATWNDDYAENRTSIISTSIISS